MAVEFGVQLPTREAVMSGRPETAPLLAMAERAEAAGFDSVWMHQFLETYYAAPARTILARQATYAGPLEGCVEWLQRWVAAGARHLMFRFAGGDQLAQVDEAASRLLPRLQRG